MDSGRSAAIVWQRWRLEMPQRWGAVKLQGDGRSGYAFFADLHRPRLGLRWATPPAKKAPDPLDQARQALRDEVGLLASQEAKAWPMPHGDWAASLLYLEPSPPGRDVWVGFSRTSGRVAQVIYHVRRRERMLAETILPTLDDLPPGDPAPWSIFELSCVVPPGMELASQRLNAGDLSLTFADQSQTSPKPRRRLTVRQVAVAGLALARMPLDRWLGQQQAVSRKHYRSVGSAQDVRIPIQPAGQPARQVAGLSRAARRRTRFFFRRDLPAQTIAYALHDQLRDRLVLVESNDDSLARAVAATVGWAQPPA